MNYDALLNPTLRELQPSGIRKFFDIAQEMQDVISLTIGEPDFSTPYHIREEVSVRWRTAKRGTPPMPVWRNCAAPLPIMCAVTAACAMTRKARFS